MRPQEVKNDSRRALEVVVEQCHAALVFIASFEGADADVVERTLLDSWRAAAAAGGSPPERLRALLVRDAIRRVAALERAPEERFRPAVDPGAFEPDGSRWAGWFGASPPTFEPFRHGGAPSLEARRAAAKALSALPLPQRVVVVLRDVADWPASEVGDILGVDPARQRVLLHAGRAGIRRRLEGLLAPR
jgi:DNA-directed RNA polymerase specialized sigma24 family protein